MQIGLLLILYFKNLFSYKKFSEVLVTALLQAFGDTVNGTISDLKVSFVQVKG